MLKVLLAFLAGFCLVLFGFAFNAKAEPGVCHIFNRAEIADMFNHPKSRAYEGVEAHDFIRSLAEAAVEAGKAPSSDAEKNIAGLPDFDEVILYFGEGYTSPVTIVLFKDNCAVSMGEFLTDIVSDAMAKSSS